MRYAILADIHANLEAFQVVLEDVKQQKCTHHVCLGDVVGYGANPKQCLDMIRVMNIPVVKGNHDEYVGVDENPDGFNDAAAEAVTWTRRPWMFRRPFPGPCGTCRRKWIRRPPTGR